MTTASPPGALAGLRVLDLTRVLAGPWCTQVLADLGADVIKVERPGSGDDSRAWGPPFVSTPKGEVTRESAFYWACNRGKRSIALDIASDSGKHALIELAAQSDVLIENFKTGTMQRLGLDYETLAARNPRLIYCAITGFGQTGPYRHRPGYDTIIQAIGGLMSVTGRQDGAPGDGPMKAGVAVTDLMTALYSAIAILAAVNERARSGQGQYIDMSLLDVQVASLANIAQNYLISGQVPRRVGNRLPTVYPSDAFACRDGNLMLIVGNDAQFARFCAATGLAGLEKEAPYATNSARVAHADALYERIAAALARGTVADWVAKFEAAGIACSPVNTLPQVFDDPQVKARGLLGEMVHRSGTPVPTVGSPMRLSRTPATATRPPPSVGEHTEQILREMLSLPENEILQIMRDNRRAEETHE